jgi:DUF971 family protein
MSQERPVKAKNVVITSEGIAIAWDDGHSSIYPHRYLRLKCACAGCVGEWPRPHQIDTSSVPLDVQALDHFQVGSYALQFLWSDLHTTGIYPFRTLRALCPCPECAAAPEAKSA